MRERRAFALENGQEQLAPCFAPIMFDTYEHTFEVTEAEPLAAYAFSGRLGSLLTNEMRESFLNLVRQELAARETLPITMASGMLESHTTSLQQPGDTLLYHIMLFFTTTPGMIIIITGREPGGGDELSHVIQLC